MCDHSGADPMEDFPIKDELLRDWSEELKPSGEMQPRWDDAGGGGDLWRRMLALEREAAAAGSQRRMLQSQVSGLEQQLEILRSRLDGDKEGALKTEEDGRDESPEQVLSALPGSDREGAEIELSPGDEAASEVPPPSRDLSPASSTSATKSFPPIQVEESELEDLESLGGSGPAMEIEEEELDVAQKEVTHVAEDLEELLSSGSGQRSTSWGESRAKKRKAKEGEKARNNKAAKMSVKTRREPRSLTLPVHHAVQLLLDPTFSPPPSKDGETKPHVIRVDSKADIDCGHVDAVVNSNGMILVRHCPFVQDGLGGRKLHDVFGGWLASKELKETKNRKFSRPQHGRENQWGEPRGDTYLVKLKGDLRTPADPDVRNCRGVLTKRDQSRRIFVVPGTKERLCERDSRKDVASVFVNRYRSQRLGREITVFHQRNNTLEEQPCIIQLWQLETSSGIATKRHREGCGCPQSRRVKE